MQTDPIGIAGGANLYAYAGNDPVNATDPSGLSRIPIAERHESSGRYLDYLGSDSRGTPEYGFGEPRLSPFQSRFQFDPESYFGGDGARANTPQDGSGFSGVPDEFVETIEVVGIRPLENQLRDQACSFPSIDIGFGADLYAGLGGSLGVNFNLDVASGQVGAGFNLAVGAGSGFEVGPSVGASPSGGGIVSLNLATSAGLGVGIGAVATRNIIGTDPGQTSGSVGRVGTPIGFVNGGAVAGFRTPKMNPLGCKGK